MTLAETLVAMVVLGMFFTMVVALIRPMLSASSQVQVKTSTVQTAAQVLYRLERDLRMTDAAGVYACTSDVVTSCTKPSGSLSGTARLAVATPLDASGNLQIDRTENAVAWTGLRVYCLMPNATGTSDLRFAYQPIAGIAPGAAGIRALSLATVASAVAQACSSNASVAATNLESIQVSANAAAGTIGVRLVARTLAGGKTNETSYQDEIYARN